MKTADCFSAQGEGSVRILHNLGSLNVGGAETMVMNIYRNINRKRFQFDFAVFGDEKGVFEDEAVALGANIFHMTKRSESFRRSISDFYGIVKAGAYKAVHFHTQNAFITCIMALTAKIAGAKTIVVHSHSASDWRSKPLVVLHKLFRPLLRLLTTTKLSCGEAAAEWLFGSKRGVQIIPLPVDCDKFLYSARLRKSLRDSNGINEETLVFSHIGRFSDVKNHDYLIDVFKEIVKVHPDSILLLMGDGELKAQTEAKVKTIGLSEKVVFCGNISNVYEKLIMSDAFLFPSKYEGFPTAVLEAQATGLPCFISDAITESIKRTSLVRRLPIEDGAKTWADCVLNSTIPTLEEKWAANKIISKDFDVLSVTELFEKVYS